MRPEKAGADSVFFFDTYALIEIIGGNKNYALFVKSKVVTTRLNLMELYYALLRAHGEKIAEYYYNFYLPACISIPDEIMKLAMKFRLRNKGLSYVDCIGYILAQKLSIKFLTGDNQFKDMHNVEFVK